MNLAIIPARGGSKRIPRKNIRDFCGRPMISYAIEAAKNSGVFQKIIVSTDDQEICDISKNLGADVPFLRPNDISDDYTPITPVINHVLDSLEDDVKRYKNICCIYPCAPLLLGTDLSESLRFMDELGVESCIPMCEFLSAPQRAFRVDKDFKLNWVNPLHRLTRTQDLEKLYHDVGTFCWASREKWMEGDISDGVAFIMSNQRVVDIDTNEDWDRAEVLYRILKL